MDLLTPTLFEVLVLEANDPVLGRNRQLNCILQPLIVVREGVETAILVLFMKITAVMEISVNDGDGEPTGWSFET
nr:hypothetical protein [uncultured Shinella sp.]